MKIDPFDELRASRPRPATRWPESDVGQEVMRRAIEQGNKSTPHRRRRLSARSSATILAGAVLVGGATVQAVGVPGMNDEPSKQSLIENSQTPLFPVDDGPMPNNSQALLARRITDLLTSDDRGSREGGVPPQFAHGIIAFTGKPAVGYTVAIGQGEDRETVVAAILEGLPPESARYLDVRVGDHSISELERVWREVLRFGRHSATELGGFSMDVDAESGRIDVTVGALTDRNRATLTRIGGDAVQMHQEPSIRRM